MKRTPSPTTPIAALPVPTNTNEPVDAKVLQRRKVLITNSLKRAGIITVADLKSHSPNDLLFIVGFSASYFWWLYSMLEKAGFVAAECFETPPSLSDRRLRVRNTRRRVVETAALRRIADKLPPEDALVVMRLGRVIAQLRGELRALRQRIDDEWAI